MITPLRDLTAPWPGVGSAPRSIDLSLTGRCNLRCRYCFYADEMAALADLPAERWLRFFEEAGALGVQRVTLSGGEIFTRPDLWTLIDGVVTNRMRYSILTNGTLVTDKVIEQFAVGKRRLRLDSIQVSIDGSCADVHDRSRPPASFERALRGLRLLKASDFPVTVRVTINRHNVDDLEAIARLLLEDVGLPAFGTNEAEQMGTARCYGQDVVLTEAERRRAMDTLTRLTERYGGRINATAGPLARARSFREIDERLAHGETGIPRRGTLCACGGVSSKLAVLHDGTMVPCNMLPSLTMGVIGVNRLADVWQRHPSINVVRARRDVPLSALPECADCPYTGFCSGGCPATVMANSGRIIGRDDLSCYRAWREEGGEQRLGRARP
jgi:SynChlorMet cassette radical SAM/SPASM protein ScmE